MAALAQWLHPVDVRKFISLHLGRKPFARPGAAASVIERCSWDLLDGLLRRGPNDVLVVSHGQLREDPSPRSLIELRTLFRRGIGLAIRSPESVSTHIEEVAREFAQDLPGEQRLIIFATPAHTHGFGWHYDAEDVFIVQTEGDKEYFLRRNTITNMPTRGFQSDFKHYREETSPLIACRLLPGDWLYVPKGYWHLAISHKDSLSLSIGVFPDEAACHTRCSQTGPGLCGPR
jgi:50S ribosomal protein L16 3-hydroxylase